MINSEKDPLEWWYGNRSSLPRMYRKACDYLSIPASFVPTEQTNSNAKFSFNDRAKLHSYSFKAEMCIQMWMELFISQGIPMLNDFHEAYEILR